MTRGLPPMPFLSFGRAHFTSANGMVPVSRSLESLPVEVRVGRKPILAVSLLASSTTASRHGSISGHTLTAASVLPQSPSRLDLLHHATPAVPVIVGDKPIDQSLARDLLQARVERRAHREAAAIELVLAEDVDDVAAHFLGEEFRRGEPRAGLAHLHAERLGLGLLAVLLGDEAVLDHAVDHPVAALDRPLRDSGTDCSCSAPWAAWRDRRSRRSTARSATCPNRSAPRRQRHRRRRRDRSRSDRARGSAPW